jgi:hypothetical protein
MKAPLCARLDPPCNRESTRLVIVAGEDRGLGRRGPPIVMLVCDEHFDDVCKKANKVGDTFVWTRCEWVSRH